MKVTKLNILVVDDEPLARDRLKILSARMDCAADISAASSGGQAIELIESQAPDVILLDVDMPDVSGLEVANHCQSLDHIPEIIFTTAHSKYAVDAFRLDATDYLLKPVKEPLLREALERALGRIARRLDGKSKAEDQRLWVKDEKGAIQLRIVDIERIEADRDYMRLVVFGHNYLVHGSMRSFEESFPDNLFVRIHRSTMVRKDQVIEIRRQGRRHFVVLQDGAELSIGPSYLKDAVNTFGSQAGGLGESETVTE